MSHAWFSVVKLGVLQSNAGGKLPTGGGPGYTYWRLVGSKINTSSSHSYSREHLTDSEASDHRTFNYWRIWRYGYP